MTSNFGDAIPGGTDGFLGKVIAGNFRIERLIGSGAMGNVYQAEQLSLGKAVAIKVLHPSLMSDDKLVLRFQREAKSASRLNHPNSVQIIDSGRDGGGTDAFYIAMELLVGRDLSQIIRDELPLPVPRIIRIMTQVLSALDEAHAQGVVHRDLKPSNIMLLERRGEPDFVKVCDYGIAKSRPDEGQMDDQMLTAEGLVCGTPEYMSPEQARGEPLDGRTDLYSASVILYQMVTGDIPFRAATPICIVSRHLSEAPAVPSARSSDPTIPADLDDLILRGLAKSREHRPASAAIFREQLEDIGLGRAGRRARGDQKTLPAEPAITDDGQTVTMRAAPRSSSHRRARNGKPLAIGLVFAACVAAAGMVALRRTRMPSIFAPAELNASSMALTHQPGALGPPSTTPGPIPELPPGTGQGREAEIVAPSGPLDGAPVHRPAQKGLPAAVNPSLGSLGSRGLRASAEGAPHDLTGRPLAAPAPPGRTDGDMASGNVLPAPPPVLAEPPRAKTRPSQEPRDPEHGGIEAISSSVSPSVAPTVAPQLPETIRDAEKLLAQGQVSEACRRGEAAKEAAPRAALAYKLLGKCYMRAGDPVRAKENYRRYLELAPTAPDVMFIESIVK